MSAGTPRDSRRHRGRRVGQDHSHQNWQQRSDGLIAVLNKPETLGELLIAILIKPEPLCELPGSVARVRSAQGVGQTNPPRSAPEAQRPGVTPQVLWGQAGDWQSPQRKGVPTAQGVVGTGSPHRCCGDEVLWGQAGGTGSPHDTLRCGDALALGTSRRRPCQSLLVPRRPCAVGIGRGLAGGPMHVRAHTFGDWPWGCVRGALTAIGSIRSRAERR